MEYNCGGQIKLRSYFRVRERTHPKTFVEPIHVEREVERRAFSRHPDMSEQVIIAEAKAGTYSTGFTARSISLSVVRLILGPFTSTDTR